MSRKSSSKKGYKKSGRVGPDKSKHLNSKDEKVEGSGSKTEPANPTSTSSSEEQSMSQDPKALPKSKSNDPTWYLNYPELVSASCNLPWSEPFGADVAQKVSTKDRGSFTITVDADSALKSAVPGVLILKLASSYGANFDRTSPLNVAADLLYTHVRYVNSGRKNYDPADLLIMNLTVAELYSFILWLQRTYALAFQYSVRNMYYGKAILEAEGWDVDDLVANLANFRYAINVMITKVSAFAVPGSINLFRRKAFIYSQYYIENGDGNIKDQFYMYSPDSFLKLSYDESASKALCLLREPVGPAANKSIAWATNMFDTLMENVTGNEDFGLMSGDIIKAYGSDIIKLGVLDEFVDLQPVYDQAVLLQMKNASCVFGLLTKPTSYKADIVRGGSTYMTVAVDGSIYQLPDGNLISYPTLDATQMSSTLKPILSELGIKTLSIPVTQVGPEYVMEFTRLTTMWDDVAITKAATLFSELNEDIYPISSGAEIVTDLVVGTFLQPTALEDKYTLYWYSLNDHISELLAYPQDSLPEVPQSWLTCVLSSVFATFKYMPILNRTHTNAAGEFKGRIPLSDVDNYTFVNTDQMYRIHQAALFSLLFVPTVAKVQN